MAKLLVVATPIGNLNDMTPRMAEALTECDIIAAEDTRVTMKLTERLGIKKPLKSSHRHNEGARADELIARMLAEDLTVALTCDAGTPGISDPGQALVAAAWDAGIQIVPVCGPSAAIAAVSIAGFDAREFAFYGFMPREDRAIDKALARMLKTEIPVAVMYESPHRVVNLLKRMREIWPMARVCVCCDLSKKFELITRGGVECVLSALENNPNAEKGEYCVVADLRYVPKPETVTAAPEARHIMLDALIDGLTLKEASAAAERAGFKRNDIYKAKLALSGLMNGD